LESGTTKIFRNVYNPGGTNGGTYVDETLRIKFYDDTYNQDSINYNVNLTKVLTGSFLIDNDDYW
jgi:hypothetical protein